MEDGPGMLRGEKGPLHGRAHRGPQGHGGLCLPGPSASRSYSPARQSASRDPFFSLHFLRNVTCRLAQGLRQHPACSGARAHTQSLALLYDIYIQYVCSRVIARYLLRPHRNISTTKTRLCFPWPYPQTQGGFQNEKASVKTS